MGVDLSMLGVAIAVACVALFVATEIGKRVYGDTLTNLMRQGDVQGYLDTLQKPLCRLVLPAWNHKYMQLNGLLIADDTQAVDALLADMLKMRQNKVQRRELVNKAFTYYIERKDKDAARTMLEEIKGWGDEAAAQQAQTTFDIYLDGSSAYIEQMEGQLDAAVGMDRGLLELMLSLQYENKGDSERAVEYFERSKAHMLDLADGGKR